MNDNYQLCCCCQELVCLKSLWTEYVWMGETEVYGNMLKECFNLSWPRTEEKDQICEVCITQLRNAVHFKQKVVQCQSSLRSQLVVSEAVTSCPPLKQEKLEIEINNIPDFEVVTKIEQADDEFNDDDDDDDDDEINNDGSGAEDIRSPSCGPVYGYRSTKSKESCFDKGRKTNESNKKHGAVRERPDRKQLKRKTTEPKTSPRRTTIKKRREVDKKTINYINPRQNVGLILEHSTILPFKSNKGYFNCFYCNKQFAVFDQLKSHVGELHDNLSFKLILKSIRRPRDRIRADVSDINCRICKKKIDNLEFLIQHLTDAHSVKFNFDSDTMKPTDCILAYDLSEGKYRCYQCKAEFFFFKTLTNHMNEHSTDHVCDVCGRCFLLADRLRAHSQSHKVGRAVKCDVCGKLCGSNLLLKSHMRYKHKKLPFMCSICDKSFPTSQKRMQHLEEVHNRAPLNLTCKICSKKFEMLKSLYSHMRSDHLNIKKEPKYGCSVCGTMFKCRNGLSHHMVVHSGEKNYECEICHKKYGRRKTLTEHLRIHMNDRRFACGACSQAFVQKCSLKNHIRVHHSDMDYEQLIVDKKLDSK